MSKTALVTGGNRGIGLAIVAGLAASGHRVLLGCRDLNAGEAAAAQIDGEVIPVELDLSEHELRMRQLDAITAAHPQIDILVNNAGVCDYRSLAQTSYDSLMRSMEVNAIAAFELIQDLAPRMQQRGFGTVVNVSSGWGLFSQGLAGPVSYSLSKATLNAATAITAQHYPLVKINALSPGWVRTDMGGAAADRSPEEGADTAIWLATLDADGPSGKMFRDRQEIDW